MPSASRHLSPRNRTAPVRKRLLVAAAAVIFPFSSGSLADPLRFDASTGADARNYPADPQADFEHMRLQIDIPDMNAPMFTAVETLTFSSLGAPMRTLSLDAKRLQIDQVILPATGRAPEWFSDGMKLQIRFDPPLPTGTSQDVRISYTLDHPVEGIYWSPARDEAPGRPARPAQLHSQGEADMNSNWFVVHDFPNDRLTTELVVTVPEGFLASSNGELVMQQTRSGRTTFHWNQNKPHVSYLVTLVVGQFDVVDVGDDRIPMPVYAPLGEGANVRQTLGATMDMVRLFEDRLDEPYPWAKYAQLVVWNFGWGGMENTSATTLYDTTILDAKALQDGDQDGLNSHELAHQWFGDLLTTNSWEHIWLNEGFATYLESLWLEARDGYDNGYLLDIHRSMRTIASSDRLEPDDADAWMRPAMVSKLYSDPDDVFTKRANPYPKGASILHMLRMKLGDDVFFKALQTYVERFKFRTVETSDFRKTLEEVSGRSLERFFDQWALRPGTPEVTVASKWNFDTGELHLTIEQTQRIDAMTPAYAFTLPILIVGENGAQTWTEIEVTGRRHERSVPLVSPPSMVVVDPYRHVLMTPTVEQPTAQLIAQLQRGPTVPSRLDAAEFLKSRPGRLTISALSETLLNSQEHEAVRAAAADALGELEATEELLAAYNAGFERAGIRRAIVAALGEIGDSKAVAELALVAGNRDESYGVQSAALAALGKTGDRTHLPILLAALDAQSQHDQIRGAALRGLAALGEPEGLDPAILYSEIGWLARTRPIAIHAIGALAEHDAPRAIRALLPLLTDPEERARDAAAAELATIGDEDALEEMRRIARTHPNPKYRAALAERADQLAAHLHEGDSGLAMRTRIEKLERELKELRAAEATPAAH